MVYTYDPAGINELEASVSSPRLSTYVRRSEGGSKEAALKLYLWNAQISAKFHFPLQIAEITLRNALHRELTTAYGPDWHAAADLPLQQPEKSKISRAEKDIRRKGRSLTSDRVVAALSFGFWTTLIGKGNRGSYHNQLWVPTLNKAFKKASVKNRSDIHSKYDQLRQLRNRIAHHEPVFSQDLEGEYRNTLDLISWHCPVTAKWVEHHCGIVDCLNKMPVIQHQTS